jgi:methylthioribose-1-phosphate isomerase
MSESSLRTLWEVPEQFPLVCATDQRKLPFEETVFPMLTAAEACFAISDMVVRGAPLIGATAAYGVALAAHACEFSHGTQARFEEEVAALRQSRPTAVNLMWAIDRVMAALNGAPMGSWTEIAFNEARAIVAEDQAANLAIGQFGLELIKEQYRLRPDRPVQVLTHCNAGWMATTAWGTATAPVYLAHAAGIPVHVWVDETRPRNQGASITAWELAQKGVPFTLISDNAGGHLMQHGQIDLCLVGADRVAANGDAANKIGTYLKALAAMDSGVPFYVALPSSTFDLSLSSGKDIPIELRSELEVLKMNGLDAEGKVVSVQITHPGVTAMNPAFDVTPARLITGLITEMGILAPEENAIRAGLLAR